MKQETPLFLSIDAVCACHSAALDEGGGLGGIKSIHALEAALGAVQLAWKYEHGDIFDIGACYGYYITLDHPFNDCNKRAAFLSMSMFLMYNLYNLNVSVEDSVEFMLSIENKQIGRADVSHWLKEHTTPLQELLDEKITSQQIFVFFILLLLVLIAPTFFQLPNSGEAPSMDAKDIVDEDSGDNVL